jgi:hypothetical protein
MFKNFFRENQNTFYVQQRFPENRAPLRDNVEKCGTAGQTTDDNMAHEHCMLEN